MNWQALLQGRMTVRRPPSGSGVDLVAIALPAIFTAVGSSALAVEPSAAQRAESLFNEAKTLMAAGKHAEACPKLEQSQSLDRALGTLLNLADCYEKLGRTASAYRAFTEATAWAKKSGERKREEVAADRAKALEKSLARLEIVVPPATVVAGLEIRRNNVVVQRDEWGTPIVVDPGNYVIASTAPGFRSREIHVVAEAAKTARVQVTALAAIAPDKPASVTAEPAASTPATKGTAPTALPPTSTPATVNSIAGAAGSPPPSGLGTLRWAAIGSAVVGVAALVAAGGFVWRARDQKRLSEPFCGDAGCDKDGYELNEWARKNANIATGLTIGGGVAAAAAVVLWLVGEPSPSSGAVASTAALSFRRPLIGWQWTF